MTAYSFPTDGPFRDRRRRDKRGRIDQGGREERRARWERGEEPHEHHGRGRGRHGGPFIPGGPGGPFGFSGPGAEFWGAPGFGGPHGPRRGRGRAGRGDVRAAIVALLADEPRNG